MREIALTKGAVAIVDDDDYEWLSSYNWHVTSNGYAARRTNRHILYMHRQIMDVQPESEIDHINLIKLDNRRENLRVCSHGQNMRNTKIGSNNSSGYKGVCYHKNCKKWVSYISINGKRYHLGCFLTDTEAAFAYNNAANEYFGEFAKINSMESAL